MKMNALIAIAITISSTALASGRSVTRWSESGDIQQAALSVAGGDIGFGSSELRLPPEAWAKDDPADSLYTLARAALGRGDYKRAAEIFHRIVERYPQSKYAGQSLYYEAFSLYRSGEDDDLRGALSTLRSLATKYPTTAKSGDAKSLLTRVCGELAKRGDQSCAQSISQIANQTAKDVTSGMTVTVSGGGCPSEDDENDDRISALNALLQMDSEQAMPILKKVLERRDACSAALRRKAVFLVSQKRTEATADILLRVAQSDPDQEVREQAVFWLSQVPGDRSVNLLETILKGNSDESIKEKALFALSQHSGERGEQILRDFASRDSESSDLREKAIFWLGQKRSAGNAEFLRGLYGRLKDEDLKEKILFSLSQQRGMGNERWIMDIAVNSKEDIELRKKALFWAGQGAASMQELVAMYDRMTESEMKDQLIFVYSQRQKDPAAIDKLFSIARTEKDPDLRKKAIFWLGQSHDPRAQQFLLDLINK
jgi:tetratricopeptide (TPR) repeat protein